jgi:hypothetical protein
VGLLLSSALDLPKASFCILCIAGNPSSFQEKGHVCLDRSSWTSARESFLPLDVVQWRFTTTRCGLDLMRSEFVFYAVLAFDLVRCIRVLWDLAT